MTQQNIATINQMIEVLRNRNAIEMLSIPGYTVQRAFDEVMAAEAQQRAGAAQVTAAAEPAPVAPVAAAPVVEAAQSNGRLYTEKELEEQLNAKLRQIIQNTPAPTAPAAQPEVEEKGQVTAWEYARVVTAQGIRGGGEVTASGLEFLGDLAQSGFYGAATLTRTASNWTADLIDPFGFGAMAKIAKEVAAERKRQAEADKADK